MFEERWCCDEEKTQTVLIEKQILNQNLVDDVVFPEFQNTKTFKLKELRSQMLEELNSYDKEHTVYASALFALSTFQNQVKQLSEEINNQSQLLLKFVEQREQHNQKIENQSQNQDIKLNQSTILNQLVKINKAISQCVSEVKSQSHSLSIDQLDNNVLLVGPKQLSQRHGDYYYEYQDGQKEYAGQFEFNKKQGLWKEYKGFDKIHKKHRFIQSEYKNGVQLGVQSSQLGQFDQQGKVGQWLEFTGNDNQLIMNGQYENGLQIGEWRIFYRDNCQCGGGQFNNEGKKTGKWIELDGRYSEKYLITYTGEYVNGLRVGEWITQEKDLKIGGGYYNENGIKINKWTEIHENYQNQLFTSCKVTFQGFYENGIRVGQWDTFNEGTRIGGGLYNKKGQKVKQWIELDDNYRNSFLNDCQVTFSGEYVDDIRVGQWITKDKQAIIGGGQYNRSGQKQGEWTELHDNYYTSAFFSCQVRLIGKYNNGMRKGTWIIVENDTQIGGGKYDDEGNKTGLWIELHQNYESTCQVTFSGVYKNGIRQGEWVFKDKSLQIGGGNFNELGIKTGVWIDPHPKYNAFCKVTYTGEYNNGVRIGKWITFDNLGKTGYGTYDDKGQQIGTWIELFEEYEQNCKVVLKGQYQNGKKQGLWNIYENQKKIAGGEYNQQGYKVGNWIELHENYSSSHKVILSGQYINGVRYGQWQTKRLKM